MVAGLDPASFAFLFNVLPSGTGDQTGNPRKRIRKDVMVLQLIPSVMVMNADLQRMNLCGMDFYRCAGPIDLNSLSVAGSGQGLKVVRCPVGSSPTVQAGFY
ncbi:hypothetical protein P175DRAFT_0557190 [Aspergillus ochraceoroseus IBT 24754]|uniref:Uncharacterized protein n=1 Tax=Aspergillus ochraceoroseus IBT 24754 TaxID=1392256 RepID=A0A2T5LW42_9EURO|nr:uncharacterized protein P175DRAFT_0557190 [Aspergillus ochraceoroseus IBT 24754]PTU20501.1 hypothetical protein P175DRAFT_0557190 [Aspergillus ochraceoroseus IBT 24754]